MNTNYELAFKLDFIYLKELGNVTLRQMVKQGKSI